MHLLTGAHSSALPLPWVVFGMLADLLGREKWRDAARMGGWGRGEHQNVGSWGRAGQNGKKVRSR